MKFYNRHHTYAFSANFSDLFPLTSFQLDLSDDEKAAAPMLALFTRNPGEDSVLFVQLF